MCKFPFISCLWVKTNEDYIPLAYFIKFSNSNFLGLDQLSRHWKFHLMFSVTGRTKRLYKNLSVYTQIKLKRVIILTIDIMSSLSRRSSNDCPARTAASLSRYLNSLSLIPFNPPWSCNEKDALFSETWDFFFIHNKTEENGINGSYPNVF